MAVFLNSLSCVRDSKGNLLEPACASSCTLTWFVLHDLTLSDLGINSGQDLVTVL